MTPINNSVPFEFLSAASQTTVSGYLDQRLTDIRNPLKDKVAASTKKEIENYPEFISYLFDKLDLLLKLNRIKPKKIQKSVQLLKNPNELIKIIEQAQGIKTNERRALESYEMRLRKQFKQRTSA